MATLSNLRHWLIEPNPQITEPAERRQAALLSSFILAAIVLSVIVEALTIRLIRWESYTGYRQTIVAIFLFLVLYRISRTRQMRLAAFLTILVASGANYISGLAVPAGVQGGLLNFLILPLWLASVYLRMRSLVLLTILHLLALLAFPWLNPQVTLNQILVGPFSFLFTVSILLIVLTHHRNQLEQDRQAELIEKEERSRREAARAEALLRVAERLNAQLDLDTLLKAICEEVTLALDTPVSFVALYDQKQTAFSSASAVGIAPDVLAGMASFPRELYDESTKVFGTIFGLPDLHVFAKLPNLHLFKQMDLRSLAFATLEYEGEIIGSLTAITRSRTRDFTEDELRLLQGLARQAALAIINTRLFKDAQRRLEHLQALRAIDLAISSNHDLRDTLDVLMKQITTQLSVDAAVILLMDQNHQHLEYGSSFGFHTPTLRFTRLRLGEGIAGRAAQQNKIIHIPDLQTDPQTLAYAPSLALEGFVSYYAAPLVAQGKVQGVLEIFHRCALTPDQEWLGFLEALAGQAAIAIDNTTLFADLQRTNDELSQAYDTTIEGWSHALDLRDKETEGHTQRVTELTLELARSFGLSDAELVHVRRGALLHDIGKMGVPDRILLKEGKLTDEEWEMMRKHPGFAHDMLQPIHYLRPALDIPYCHHEKWDGSGYPRGLKGEEIPLTARIFAVVDVWDALTSDRPYRAAWSPEKTLAHIQEGAGSHFDPQVVQAFVGLLERKAGSAN